MKYIDADKLLAEIERRIYSIENCPLIEAEFGASRKREGKLFAYKELLSFIASFQQEQSDIIDYICLYAGIPAPFMDGNQWCILKGDNIQVGVVGFGDTKEDALINFIKDIPLQHEPAKGIDGVVHHYLNTYWIVTDKKQLATALKVFPEGAEVELFIFAKKEGAK